MTVDDFHRQAFREEAVDLLSELETSVLELEDDPGNLEVVNRVFRAMHTIKGSGAMFGFDDIASFTHEVETIFDRVRGGDMPVTKDLLDLTLSARDHISLLLDHANEDVTRFLPDGEKILQGFRSLAGATLEPDEARAPEASEQPAEETPDEAMTYRVRFKPHPDFFASGNDPAYMLDDLRQLGACQIFAHYESLPNLADLDPEQCYLWWDVILTTASSELAIRDVFLFAEDHAQILVTCLDDGFDGGHKKLGEILLERGDVRQEDLAKALAGQQPLGVILTGSGAAGEKAVASALAEQNTVRQARTAKEDQATAGSIRVSSDKLDLLQDLVGELVIVQGQMKQGISLLEDPFLRGLSEQLERLSDAFRDSTLGIRMLPIGSTFSKFRRLVRDLSAQTGKEVELITRGEDTELDKMVLERLGDALVHLLRNSIDHGLETPDERVHAGKPSKGTLSLTAEHSGGEVLICITDDGRGIDPQRVRAKAVERGIIPPDCVLTEKETIELIFRPGFSTAETISSVSGRGVGMDVVKRVIDSMRGDIEIESEMGKGTLVNLRIPLTLAIIDGLTVRVGLETYVLPLDYVEECVEMPCDANYGQDCNHLLHVRGNVVPYIRMGDWLSLQKDRGKKEMHEHIIIVAVDGIRFGLLVDQVVGEHQTVIKSLGPVFRKLVGFSGATIQGDGTMSLILDVKALAQQITKVKQ